MTEPEDDLLDVLEAENALLRALDLRGAGDLLDRKQAALAALPALRTPSVETVARLRAAAEDNRALLRHAIEVQGRVVALIAGAIAEATPRGEGYGRFGARLAQAAAPVAIRARV